MRQLEQPVEARVARAIHVDMDQESTAQALARIELALARIEAVAARPRVANDDSRYQALRTRTQAALASLETVIARAGGAR